MQLSDNGNGKNTGLKKEVDLLVGKGEQQRALKLIEDASRKDPSDWYLPYLRGWIYQTAHRVDEALENYQQAEELAPDNPHLKAVIGELLLARGEPDIALPYLESCVIQWPTSSEAFSFYGTALLRTNSYEAAEKALKKSRELSANNPDARAGLIELYDRTSRTHLIKPMLEAYVRDAPDLASSHTFMAEHVFYHDGDCEGACTYYKKGIDRFLKSPNPAWFNQYMSTLDYPNAIFESYLNALMNCEYFEVATKVAREHLDSVQEMAWRADIHLKQGENGAAMEIIRQAVQAAPEEPGLRAALAKHLLINKDPGAAEQEIRTAIELGERMNVEEPWYWGTLAVSLIEQDRNKEADVLIGNIDPRHLDRLNASMIHVYDELRNWGAVEEKCREVLGDDPNEAVALHFLARALMGLDQATEAIEIYQQLLEQQPNNGRAQLELGSAYERAGLTAEAKTAYERALAGMNLSKPQRSKAQNALENLT